jgi:hypothetical protein
MQILVFRNRSLECDIIVRKTSRTDAGLDGNILLPAKQQTNKQVDLGLTVAAVLLARLNYLHGVATWCPS